MGGREGGREGEVMVGWTEGRKERGTEEREGGVGW